MIVMVDVVIVMRMNVVLLMNLTALDAVMMEQVVWNVGKDMLWLMECVNIVKKEMWWLMVHVLNVGQVNVVLGTQKNQQGLDAINVIMNNNIVSHVQ